MHIHIYRYTPYTTYSMIYLYIYIKNDEYNIHIDIEYKKYLHIDIRYIESRIDNDIFLISIWISKFELHVSRQMYAANTYTAVKY